jgi:4-hydroxythreonine-4-phosphate dehydrogenase
MGDPAGVGPEVCLHLLADNQIAARCVPVLFGDAGILWRVAAATNLPLNAPIISHEQWDLGWSAIERPCVVDLQTLAAKAVHPGVVSAATGRAGYTYVDRAIDAALAGQVAAVSTAPLNKEAMHAAGINYPGHTEIFAARTNAPRSCMMQYSEEITCTFVTFVGYKVPRLLTKERILDVIELTAAALERLRGKPPKIVVCGLNPHAGEHGLFGEREEERIINPAIEAARQQGTDIEGPLPPDTAFLPWKRKATDAFVCM